MDASMTDTKNHASAGPGVTDPTSLDQTVDALLATFHDTGRLDGASEQMRAALAARLLAHGIPPEKMRLVEVNVLGNLAGWIEFVLQEREAGRDTVPDFSRNLREIFISHCRKHEVDPKLAVDMAVELATAILDLALVFQTRLGLRDKGTQQEHV